ncbi:MAG: DUF2809 domain-containing protein [Beijerinckiaceae bacterium]|nr:DUF2809 domain-containing protein [Beijerinckiaceae bacterium]
MITWACGFMIAGLIWRLAPLGLPRMWWSHGGNVFWGAMVFCFAAGLRPARANRVHCVLAVSLFSVGLELFRLFHTPTLDAFRQTLAGALLVGRVFSVWNMVDYETGIVLAAWILWRHN